MSQAASSLPAALLLAPQYVRPTPTLKGNGKSWVVTLTGTSGDDVFDPGTNIGASTMIGNGGNDVFYVHSGADHVVESAGPGSATVIVDGFAAYTLPANVANLVGAATFRMVLTGNAMANIIRANDLGDTINGGAGNDTLVGGAGRDTFIEAKGNGSDTIVNFQAGAGADVVSPQNYGLTNFTAVQNAMTQVGANAVLNLGGGETLTFTGHTTQDFVAANFGMPTPAPAPVAPALAPATVPYPAPGSKLVPTPAPAPVAPARVASPPPPPPYTYAALVPQASGGSDVVGLALQNPGATALAGREITFGQEFAPGQVPAGRLLQAVIGGVTVPVQMDVKTTNPDGSVSMAVLTLAQPALAAGASDGVMLQLAPAGTTQGPAVNIGALGGGYDLTVDIARHNADGSTTAFHIDAAQALAAALAKGTTSTWLSGPQATQVRVDVPVAGSLHVTLDITAYANGSTSTDVQFNNDIAMSGSGGAVRYDATISQNGAPVFAQANVDQFQYTTWHEVISSNAAPGVLNGGVNVQHDTAALAAAGFVQNYDPSTGVATALITADTAQMSGSGTTVLGTPSFGVLGTAGVTQYMPTTGGRADIGPTTQANTIWLMTQNAQAQTYALAQADAAGSVPWHLYNPATGADLTTSANPILWADPRGGSAGTTGLTQPLPDLYSQANPESGWSVDPAHQPDLSYDAYLLTGSRYYLDQLNAQASYDILAMAPSYRQGGKDLVVNGLAQVRMQAWDLRQLQEAAFIDPDNGPLKAYFVQAVNSNFTNLLSTIIPAATASQGQAAGWIPSVNNATDDLVPWQEDYFGQVVIMAAEQGNAQAVQVLHWESNFLVGRFLQGSNGFDPHDGAAYDLKIGAPGNLLQTWAGIEQASTAAGLGSDFSGGWATPAYPGYRQWAEATLAGDITVEHSPQALQAYGWLVANSGITPAWQANHPLYDIVPRLADGNLLTASNIHILAGSASSAVSFGNADQLVYDNGSAGSTTITGGSGIDILFAGTGHDLLIGGGDDDFLFGGAGADTLAGGAGHNWLQAGSAGTQFNLSTQDIAQDIVAGFTPGRDHLHVTGAGGAPLSPGQLQSIVAGATTTAGNTTLTLSPIHTVTLNALSPTQLAAAVFV